MKKIILIMVMTGIFVMGGVTANAETRDYEISYDIVASENGNNMNVVYTLHNEESESKSAVLFVVLYEDGRLVRCKKTETVVSANGTKTENAVLPLESGGNVYTVKVMAFENLTGLKPLGTCKFIKDVEPYSRQKHLYINSFSDSEFNVYMNSLNSIGNNDGMTHTVIYNSSVLLPVDLCGFTYEKELAAGEIENTGIIIQNADLTSGKIVFKFKTQEDRNTGINNFVKFKALTELTQEEIIYIIQ